MVTAPREEKPLVAFAMMSFAVLCFTCIDTSAKWLILGGLPAIQVVFTRYLGHFVLATGVSLVRDGPSVLGSANPRIQLLRSLALLGSTIFNFSALQYLPITLTTAIFFSQPMVVSLMAIPVLGEKVGLRRMMAIFVGFLGVLVVVQPWGAAFHPAVFFSLGALTCASAYFVLTRKLAGTESNSTSQIWASGLATAALLPFALHIWVWPETPGQWVFMIVIGLFGAVGHVFATAAHRLADASTLAPIVYEQVFFVTIAGWLVFGSLPTHWTAIGCAIIVGSGFYIWQRERVLRKRITRIDTRV